jgi:hypothetical protein
MEKVRYIGDGLAPTLPGLFREIVADLQTLFEQQMMLFKEEMQRDIKSLKTAAVLVGAGAGILSLGVVFLLLMLVHVLHTDGELPLWACYGIVGGGLAAAGAGVAAWGTKRLQRVSPLPRESAQALKETVQCLTNRKQSA